MDGPTAYYTKWKKSDWERQILCDFIYVWTIKNTNEQTKQNRNRYKEKADECQQEEVREWVIWKK